MSKAAQVEVGSGLAELADRCEAAEGPSFALDHDIVAALDIDHQNRWALASNAGVEPNPYPLPPYTASLDAAMTLVPEGWARRIEDWPRPAGQSDMASDDGPNAKAVIMECFEKRIGKQLVWGFHTPGSKSFEARAATPALALCAAALRARAAMEDVPND